MKRVFLLLFWAGVAGGACGGADSTVKVDPQAQAREDAKTLMSSIVTVAEKALLRDGTLTPLGFAIKGDGQIVEVVVGEQEKPAGGALESVRSILLDQAHSGVFRATALATERRIKLPNSEVESNAVQIAIDHKADYSVVLVFPYVLSDGKLEWSPPFTEAGSNQVFAR